MDAASAELALLWVLNLSDGECSVLDIVERSGLAPDAVRDAVAALLAHGLLEAVDRVVSGPTGRGGQAMPRPPPGGGGLGLPTVGYALRVTSQVSARPLSSVGRAQPW